MRFLSKLFLAIALLSSTAVAQAKLETRVFTGSPEGFLVTSTLVSGANDAILIDAQFAMADAYRLVGWLIESRKNLTTVYITHAHPDHYFGLEVVKQAFPEAKIVALPAVIEHIRKTGEHKVAEWKPLYGRNITSKPVVPSALAGKTLTLEGETLEIVGPVQGDDNPDTYVWIPSIRTLVAGDTVFSGVYPWTAETTPAERKGWIKTLDGMAARNPAVVIPGHQRPEVKPEPASLDFMRRYLTDFDEALASSKTPEELQGKVKAKYPDLALDIILKIAVDAAFKPGAK
jgi:glyoxylase-like metal-dependent hydrolase (beta-lactamase superfamily II)